MTSPAISSDFKLLDFRYVNRDKYEYSDLEKVNARLMVSNCYYSYDASRKYLYYFETPRLRTLTEVYKVGDKFMLDLVVPLGSLFMEYLVSEDEKNIATTIDNSIDWFGSQIPPEVANEKYKSSLVLRGGGEDPVFRVVIPSYRGKPVLEVYDNMRRPVDISRIKPDMEIACICQKVGIRFSNTTFSGEYDCYKLKITQQQPEAPKIPSGYMFNDNNEEMDVNNYAQRLMASDENELGNSEDEYGHLEDELSDSDSVLNELEEVAFTEDEDELELPSDTDGEDLEGEELEGENLEGEDLEGENLEGENLEGEDLEGENLEGEDLEGENLEGEDLEGENLEGEESEVELTEEDLEGLEEMVVAEDSENEEDSGEESGEDNNNNESNEPEDLNESFENNNVKEEGETDVESVNLESSDESDLDELGLEEVAMEGNVNVEELEHNPGNEIDSDIDELGLEQLDLTPSKKTNKKDTNLNISELTDDFLDNI